MSKKENRRNGQAGPYGLLVAFILFALIVAGIWYVGERRDAELDVASQFSDVEVAVKNTFLTMNNARQAVSLTEVTRMARQAQITASEASLGLARLKSEYGESVLGPEKATINGLISLWDQVSDNLKQIDLQTDSLLAAPSKVIALKEAEDSATQIAKQLSAKSSGIPEPISRSLLESVKAVGGSLMMNGDVFDSRVMEAERVISGIVAGYQRGSIKLNDLQKGALRDIQNSLNKVKSMRADISRVSGGRVIGDLFGGLRELEDLTVTKVNSTKNGISKLPENRVFKDSYLLALVIFVFIVTCILIYKAGLNDEEKIARSEVEKAIITKENRELAEGVDNILPNISRMGAKDLTVHFDEDHAKTGPISKSLNMYINNFRYMMMQVIGLAANVSSTTEQTARTSSEMATESQESLSLLRKTRSLIEEMVVQGGKINSLGGKVKLQTADADEAIMRGLNVANQSSDVINRANQGIMESLQNVREFTEATQIIPANLEETKLSTAKLSTLAINMRLLSKRLEGQEKEDCENIAEELESVSKETSSLISGMGLNIGKLLTRARAAQEDIDTGRRYVHDMNAQEQTTRKSLTMIAENLQRLLPLVNEIIDANEISEKLSQEQAELITAVYDQVARMNTGQQNNLKAIEGTSKYAATLTRELGEWKISHETEERDDFERAKESA